MPYCYNSLQSSSPSPPCTFRQILFLVMIYERILWRMLLTTHATWNLAQSSAPRLATRLEQVFRKCWMNEKHELRKSAHLVISGVIRVSLPNFLDIKILWLRVCSSSQVPYGPLLPSLLRVSGCGVLWATLTYICESTYIYWAKSWWRRWTSPAFMKLTF